jgi:hypothetical protein
MLTQTVVSPYRIVDVIRLRRKPRLRPERLFADRQALRRTGTVWSGRG